MDLTDAPSHPLITDPFLLSTLSTLSAARDAALHILTLTSTLPSTSPSSSDSPPDNTPYFALSRSQKPLLTHLAHLRSHNRRLAHLTRATKQQTSTSRSEVDTLHLSLQNLHYESRHLVGEIAACEGFEHTYMQLPLISEEEFLDLEGNEEWRRRREGMRAEASEADGYRSEGDPTDSQTQSKTVSSIDHDDEPMPDNSAASPSHEDWSDVALMHARINAEMTERQRLDEVRKGLVSRKMELVRENAKRKEELGKLDSQLEAFVDAAKPIQKTFEKEW